MRDSDDFRDDDDLLLGGFRSGRWVRLVPFSPQYLSFLHTLLTREPNLLRQFSGLAGREDDIIARLADDALVQFVVLSTSTLEPIGIARAYKAQIPNGIAFAEVAVLPELRHTGIGTESGLLLCRYLFATWNLRKLYVEVPEYELASVRNHIGTLLVEEGRLGEHLYHENRRWDLCIFAIYRSSFGTFISPSSSAR
jgi:RimJ/RimL family protein N-acetyltransferase